jgi:hypothetical protein
MPSAYGFVAGVMTQHADTSCAGLRLAADAAPERPTWALPWAVMRQLQVGAAASQAHNRHLCDTLLQGVFLLHVSDVCHSTCSTGRTVVCLQLGMATMQTSRDVVGWVCRFDCEHTHLMLDLLDPCHRL